VADKSELQHIPRVVDALVLSEAHSSLIARASNDAKALMARKPEPALRAKVKVNGKWGLIDTTGRFVVEPFCCEIRRFSCGMAAFSDTPLRKIRKLYQRGINDFGRRQDSPLGNLSGEGYYETGNWGFVSDNWKIAIPAIFKRALDFSENLAGVVHNAKWGFLSKDGNFAIEPTFGAVGDFSEGMCLAKFNGKYGFIDSSGKFIVQPGFRYLWNFSEGLACAEMDNKYCFINRSGEIVIPPVFDNATDFDGGVAHAELDGRSCIINPMGSVVFICTQEKDGDNRFEKEEIGRFADGLALVSGRYLAPLSDCSHDHPGCNGVCADDPCSCPRSSLVCERCSSKYGYYINKNGKQIPMPQGIVGIGDFIDGLALVEEPRSRRGSGQTCCRMGYINTQGEVVIAPQFDSAEDFADGIARVFTEDEEWRLIDKECNFVDTSGSADSKSEKSESPVREGLKRIESAGLYGFADDSGNVVIEPRFAYVDYFSNGMARFKATGLSDGKWGFIDRTGAIVIPPQFEDADNFAPIADSVAIGGNL
jgi:hypothetical protein